MMGQAVPEGKENNNTCPRVYTRRHISSITMHCKDTHFHVPFKRNRNILHWCKYYINGHDSISIETDYLTHMPLYMYTHPMAPK